MHANDNSHHSYSVFPSLSLSLSLTILFDSTIFYSVSSQPTNHLDLEAVLWLQSYLQTYQHTVLLVSHDRSFLNEVCTDIMLFKNLKLTYFKGNYDAFESTDKEMKLVQQRQHESQMVKVQHMQVRIIFLFSLLFLTFFYYFIHLSSFYRIRDHNQFVFTISLFAFKYLRSTFDGS